VYNPESANSAGSFTTKSKTVHEEYKANEVSVQVRKYQRKAFPPGYEHQEIAVSQIDIINTFPASHQKIRSGHHKTPKCPLKN
jgi:hypothetical protein